MPKFSVIIPLYNKENYIQATLQSVLRQDFEDFEVLIIDDCGTDNSVEKAKEIQDSRIRHIAHEKNKGLSASRNTGIQHAKAHYLAFLDADDQWKPQFLSEIDALIAQYGKEAALFATKYEVRFQDGKTTVYPFPNIPFEGRGLIEDFFSVNLGYNFYCPSSLCASKAVFDTIGGYDETIQYSEDVDFNIRAHLVFKMAFSNQALVTYNAESENQITQGAIKNKRIPDYDSFERQDPNHESLKKYLDFQRYLKAKLFKMVGDLSEYKKLRKGINKKNLNWKQNLLISLPGWCLRSIVRLKHLLLKKGVNVNSY